MSAEYKPAGSSGCLAGIAAAFVIAAFSGVLAGLVSLFLGPIGIFIAIIVALGSFIYLPIIGAMQIVGPCPYCHRHIGVGQSGSKGMPGGAFNCPHCKSRILVTKHNPRFVKPGETDISEGKGSLAPEKEPGEFLGEISIEKEAKKCPMCAETIKLEAKKCRFCNHLFDVEEVEHQIEERKREIGVKKKEEMERLEKESAG